MLDDEDYVTSPLPDAGESRGTCRLCGLTVFSTQERCKDEMGEYLHKKCYDGISALRPLPVGQV